MELLIALLYYFRQGAKLLGENINTLAGNLDPSYLLAPMYLFKNYKDKNKIKKIVFIILPMVLYSIIQIILIPDRNIIKMVINIGKIGVCIIATIYTIENYRKINILKVTKIIAILYAISIPLSYIFIKNDIIWRHNDFVNKYNLQRLNLFYLEPSELGFHVVVILIFLIGYFLKVKDRSKKITLLLLICTNCIILFMARPLGAIVIGFAAIGGVFIFDLIYTPSKEKVKFYTILAILAILVVIFMMLTKNSIYLRIIETINGTDSSNSYRIGVTLDVLKESFFDFNAIGCGFGNLNTPQFLSTYSNLGLVVVVTNSFIYYIIETGIFGIITLGLGIFLLIKGCIKSRSPIKWGLLILLLMYQIFAGHFTSGLYWILYGIILSNYNENYNYYA